MNKLMSSSKVASVGEEVKVIINDEVVESVAQRLAVTMAMSNDSILKILNMDQAQECFSFALRLVLCQDSGAKPSFEVVPLFLSDITFSLNTVYRGVRIRVTALDVPKRPHSYGMFLDVLESIGVPSGKILKVDPQGSSSVLKLGVVDFNGADILVGVDPDTTIEELVVRAMLRVQEEEQEKIARIIGHMDNLYVSCDELVRQWACALPVGRRG